MAAPWTRARPELVEDVGKSLEGPYANLHLFTEGHHAEVRGSFPVLTAEGAVVDRYDLRIRFADNYPDTLPAVTEVGGRIPKTGDRHVFEDSGECCVILEDTRWESFPIGASFRTYLEVPLHNYLLGQSLVEAGEPWPFGDWSHAGEGILEYYGQVLQSDDLEVVCRFVDLLALAEAKGHHPCYCGTGKRLRYCCSSTIALWRQRVPPRVAKRSADWLSTKKLTRTKTTRRTKS